VSISTFNSENLIGYAQSAGNFSLLFFPCVIKADKSSSETTRETSFNFEAYRKITGNTPEKISDN